nr:phage tail protein [Enterobacter roggenkampii]
MAGTNDFKAFATGAGANVMSQADWEALPALLSGFTAGKASSAQVNKAIRQASFIAAALAQYTANKSGLDVLDDGDVSGFIAKMTTALGKDFQGLDATLTALAGLTTGANKLPYFTGTDTAAQTDLTSVGRDIIGKSTIADILTYLGLWELSIAGVSGGSLTASGYITIPMIINGARRALYIQWGGFSGTTSSSGSNGIYEVSNITVTWPVAFPNVVFQVITGGSSDVSGVGQQEMAWSLFSTKTSGSFGFQCRTPNASMTGSYLVIGY